MIRNFIVLVLVISFVSCKKQSKKESQILAKQIELRNKNLIGTKYPSFYLPLDNGNFSNKDLQGKVVFMNFWFEGCAPCIAELDQLNELYDRFRDSSKFKFISISFNSIETIKRVKEKYKIEYKVLAAPEEFCKKLNLAKGYPCSIIIDSNGIIKYINDGGPLEKKQIKEYIEKVIYPILRKELDLLPKN